MLKDLIKLAALKAAEEYRSEGDFAKVRFALSLARRAAGIDETHQSAFIDGKGCVHVAVSRRQAFGMAAEFNQAYV